MQIFLFQKIQSKAQKKVASVLKWLFTCISSYWTLHPVYTCGIMFYPEVKHNLLIFFFSELIMAKEELGLDWPLCKRNLLNISWSWWKTKSCFGTCTRLFSFFNFKNAKVLLNINKYENVWKTKVWPTDIWMHVNIVLISREVHVCGVVLLINAKFWSR